DDLRLTRVGRLLQRTSLDELPQLVNVVSGRMSLVGPRPLLAAYLDKYSTHHARRHDVRPGITGLAQVSGRKSVAYSQKLDLDVLYIDEWSFRLDLRILFKTLIEPFKRPEYRGYAEFDDLGLTLGPPWEMSPTHIEECGSDRGAARRFSSNRCQLPDTWVLLRCRTRRSACSRPPWRRSRHDV